MWQGPRHDTCVFLHISPSRKSANQGVVIDFCPFLSAFCRWVERHERAPTSYAWGAKKTQKSKGQTKSARRLLEEEHDAQETSVFGTLHLTRVQARKSDALPAEKIRAVFEPVTNPT